MGGPCEGTLRTARWQGLSGLSCAPVSKRGARHAFAWHQAALGWGAMAGGLVWLRAARLQCGCPVPGGAVIYVIWASWPREISVMWNAHNARGLPREYGSDGQVHVRYSLAEKGTIGGCRTGGQLGQLVHVQGTPLQIAQ